MKPTLLILAAGIGNRYGGLKQIDPMGPSGETLMEYGIYDAISAGFEKAVFLFRDNIISAFEKKYHKLQNYIDVGYAFQDINPEIRVKSQLITYPERSKPWGTAHAILSAATAISDPFAVINADDFYGSGAYQEMFKFLKQTDIDQQDYAVVGYPIEKTLSDYGMVSRALIQTDQKNCLTNVVERTKIEIAEGGIQYHEDHQVHNIEPGTLVSTNFWGFTPTVFTELQDRFVDFVKKYGSDPKSEFFIPTVVNDLVARKEATVRVLTCRDNWMGVTYKEDKATVMGSLNSLIAKGVYPQNLWN